MAKNKKKIIAIVSALALLVAAVPVMSQATGVDSDNDATSTSDATSSTDASSKKKEEENILGELFKLYPILQML